MGGKERSAAEADLANARLNPAAAIRSTQRVRMDTSPFYAYAHGLESAAKELPSGASKQCVFEYFVGRCCK
jgi:hypothetical protein